MGEMDVVYGRSPAQKQILYMTKSKVPSEWIYNSAPPSEGKEVQSSFLENGGEIFPPCWTGTLLKTEIFSGHGRLLDPEPADI